MNGWHNTPPAHPLLLDRHELRKRASRTDVQMESTLGFGYLRNEHVYNSMGQQTQEHVYQRWSGERYSSQYWVYASFDWTHYRSLVNRHDQTRWFWDSGWKEAVVARTDYLYDQYSLTNRGTVTQHDPTFDSSYASRRKRHRCEDAPGSGESISDDEELLRYPGQRRPGDRSLEPLDHEQLLVELRLCLSDPGDRSPGTLGLDELRLGNGSGADEDRRQQPDDHLHL